MIATGELMLLMADPRPYFESVAPTLQAADVVVGHLENLHPLRPAPAWDPMHPAPDPDKMTPLIEANYSIVTLAGNPAYCYGPPGIADTITWLNANGIDTVGAGMNIKEAIRPAIIKHNNTRIGFLNYHTVGSKENGASPTKPGVAYVDIITHYEPARLTGMLPEVFTWPEPWSLRAMREAIQQLRPQCDVLVVTLHMGIGGRETILADYERPLTMEAIDAGADLILGTHCHMLKGVEFYRGKPIFHCLGNLVAAWPPDEYADIDLSEIEPMARSLARSRYRGVLDGGLGRYYRRSGQPRQYSSSDFRNNAALFRFEISAGVVTRLSYVPCLINEMGHPIVVGRSDGGQQVFDYMRQVTEGADLNACYEWDGEEVVIAESSR